jgi:hypothetical protein
MDTGNQQHGDAVAKRCDEDSWLVFEGHIIMLDQVEVEMMFSQSVGALCSESATTEEVAPPFLAQVSV